MNSRSSAIHGADFFEIAIYIERDCAVGYFLYDNIVIAYDVRCIFSFHCGRGLIGIV